MEKLDVFDCSNIFIACYFTTDKACSHCNREHTLIYIYSGELDITEGGHTTTLRPGECAFLRRDNRMLLHKHASEEGPYRSVVLKFSNDFLKDFYRNLKSNQIPKEAKRNTSSLYVLPHNRPDIRSLFESLLPYFDAGVKPADEILRLKMTEGFYTILNTDVNLYASLFDFADPWKINIIDFMEKNYMNEMSMAEIALYTGRSLSTFKRDFHQYSNLTPQKWIIRRRLEAAHELLQKGGKKISDICYEVGFKNLSHFYRLYKETYGLTPGIA